MALTVLQWRSKKVTRICRSALSADAQAAPVPADELQRCKIFLRHYCAVDCLMSINGDAPLATDAAKTKASGAAIELLF